MRGQRMVCVAFVVAVAVVALLSLPGVEGAAGAEQLEGLVRDCGAALRAVESSAVTGTKRSNQQVMDALGVLHSARVVSYQSVCEFWGAEYGARELFFSEVLPEVHRLLEAYAGDMRSMNDLRPVSGLLLSLSYPPSGANDCTAVVTEREALEERLRESTIAVLPHIVDVLVFAVEEKGRVEASGGGMGEAVPTFLQEYRQLQLWGCNVVAKLVHASPDSCEALLATKRAWAVVSHLAEPNNLCYLAVKEVIELLRLDETLTDLHLALTGDESVLDIVNIIREHASDADYINLKYARDWTALMAAVTHKDAIPILLELVKVPGLDVNAMRLDGWSALDIAVDQNVVDAIRLLVRHGASSVSMDQANHFNVDVAHAFRFPLCVQEGDRCVIDFSNPIAEKPQAGEGEPSPEEAEASHVHDEL